MQRCALVDTQRYKFRNPILGLMCGLCVLGGSWTREGERERAWWVFTLMMIDSVGKQCN